MIPWYWSWILALATIVGLWYTGNKQKSGWLVLILTNVLWIAYGLVTRQYGFILGAVATSLVHLRNYLKWRSHE